MAKPPKPPPGPSAESLREAWEITLYQYVCKREWQTFDAIAETEKLFAMLREEANDLHRVADRVEQWGHVVEKHPVDEIKQRLAARGYGRDVTAQRFLGRIVDPTPEVPHTPTDLRRLAGAITDAVEYENISLTDCKDYLEGLQQLKKSGRRTKSAFHVLLTRATNQGIGDAELARRLAVAGVAPEKPSARRLDLAERWRQIIKAARRRPGLKGLK